jgi:hypothetical protein
MNKALPKIASIGLLLILVFHIFLYFEQKNNQQGIHIIQQQIEKKEIKKVYYADGEYEKEYKKWKEKTNDLFQQVSENMLLPFEQIVMKNYLNIEKEYSEMWKELICIEPTNLNIYKHKNLIQEARAGFLLCDSYINNIKQFDNCFKNLFIVHQQNTKIKN